MAETSYLWDNPGTGDSPALGYGNSILNQVIFRMLANGTGDQGVLKSWLNELQVTDGGVDTATVATGAAMLYGVWYETDAAVNVNINAYRGGNCLIIVRASWASQTARIVARAVGALTQTAGVTYEIPLANVAIDGAGAITLVTDTRDYCEFSTDIWPFTVGTADIQTDAVTPAKIADITRWFDRGHGCMEPDVTNPPTWTSHITYYPNTDVYDFSDAALEALWVGFRVPADYAGGGVSVVLKNQVEVVFPGGGDVRWLYSAEVAAPSGVFANQAGNNLQTFTTGVEGWNQGIESFALVSLVVNSGDMVLLRVSRDGAHGTDTFVGNVSLFDISLEYTADS